MCDIINIKLMKCGGIYPALQISEIAKKYHKPCIVGCMSESRLGIAAAAAVVVAKDNIESADLDTLCKEADILSIHLPLNEETFNIINKERIALMKRGAILINVARGAVTDEEAVAEAFLEGRLGGLGIDVYSKEPFSKEHPFQKILHSPRAILTPHTAWGSIEARNRCLSEVAENIRAFAEGEDRNRII